MQISIWWTPVILIVGVVLGIWLQVWMSKPLYKSPITDEERAQRARMGKQLK